MIDFWVTIATFNIQTINQEMTHSVSSWLHVNKLKSLVSSNADPYLKIKTFNYCFLFFLNCYWSLGVLLIGY